MSKSPAVDLRSDTVTKPSAAMRHAMAEAEVGDDVLDGDPTTRRLEARLAETFGCDAALFFPSGTQANQTGINVVTSPGTEVICDVNSHIVHYEKAGLAALSGVQPRMVAAVDGCLAPEDVSANCSDSPYASRVSAVSMENTHNMAGGTVMSGAAMRAVADRARQHGLGVHLDGARVWHAAAAAGFSLEDLGRSADTIMACFSKGMGCPVGSCLAGNESLISEAWHVRKRFGGGMRQSGILAAACLYALDNYLPRVAEDHETAREFARVLRDHPRLTVSEPQTNIVMIELHDHTAADALASLRAEGVLLVPVGPNKLRAVTHMDVSPEDTVKAARLLGDVLERAPA